MCAEALRGVYECMNDAKKEQIRLQSILFPTNDLCNEETVYYHNNGLIQDFDGYFNLFYIEKRKKYTNITELALAVLLKGYSRIILMHDRDEVATAEIDNPDVLDKRSVKFPYDDYDQGVFWFRLVKKSIDADTYISGCYMGTTINKQPAKVFVDICTYKREEYVVRNMIRLAGFLDNPENKDISDNIVVALIDNGQTLHDCTQLQGIIEVHNQISIIRNSNTGGAGGFTRGMEEALDQKEEHGLTHVLLMDDDALFDEDLFVRLYGILSTLRDQYKELTIGGALWRLDYPYIQWASGEWWENFRWMNPLPSMDLRSYEEVTQKEMCTTDNKLGRYSGWWCCCYSLELVTNENLPMKQMFIHMDDVEYEIRNRLNGNPVAFFNGVGLWHKSFDADFAGWKKYYDTRNQLIFMAMNGPRIERKEVLKHIRKEMTGALFNMRYLEMQLTYMGTLDFLKGKDWLDNLDTEKHHSSIMQFYKDNTEWQKLKDIDAPIVSDEFEITEGHLSGVPFEKLMLGKTSIVDVMKEPKRFIKNHIELLVKKVTLNGWLLPSKKKAYVVTPLTGIWRRNFRYHSNVFVPFDSGKGIIRNRDYKQVWNMIKMYRKLKRLYTKDFSYVGKNTTS